MPSFAYEGLDESGRAVTGQVVADSEKAASVRVRELGHFPTVIRETEERAAAQKRAGGLFGGRVTRGDLTVFTRQLASLLQAGMPVVRALNVLIENTENARLAEVVGEVRDEVQSGANLWETLGQHPRVFNDLYCNMVQAGEASGELENVLDRLAEFLEREQEQWSHIRSAMAYPILLVSAGMAAVFFLITFLIPRFSQVFEDFGQALPAPTQFLLNLAGFMGSYWWALLGGGAVLVLALRAYGRTESGAYLFDSIKLRIPVFGRLVQRLALCRFSRTLATLLHGGVSILESLSVVRGAVGSRPLAEAIDEIYAGVREGEAMAEPLRRTGRFPPLVTNMIAVGEETGDLEDMLNRVADAYELEVQNMTRQLISLLEPLIILTMGVIVGFVVISMLLPIFEMNVFAG